MSLNQAITPAVFWVKTLRCLIVLYKLALHQRLYQCPAWTWMTPGRRRYHTPDSSLKSGLTRSWFLGRNGPQPNCEHIWKQPLPIKGWTLIETEANGLIITLPYGVVTSALSDYKG